MSEAPDTERLVALGIAAMFGSLLVHGALAALIGRIRSSFEAGLAVGLVLFGLTGLAIGAGVAWVLFVLSAEVPARPAGCEDVAAPAGAAPAGAGHRRHFVAIGDARLRLATGLQPGACPRDEAAMADAVEAAGAIDPAAATEGVPAAPPQAASADQDPGQAAAARVLLRYRRAAPHSQGGPVPAEVVQDARQAPMAVGVFGAFGGFWFLAGLTLLASRRESLRPAVDRTASPWRARWSTTFTVVGNLLVVGCVVGASLPDWEAERSTRFAFRGVALACVFYAAAMALRRRLTLATALTLLIIGGGFALAAWSLDVLG